MTDKTDSRDILIEEIENLEKVVPDVPKPVLPTVTLEQMSYTPPTDEELYDRARSGLEEYKAQETAAIRENSQKNEKALESKRSVYASGMDDEISALNKKYRAASDSIDSDVIKRGLARSSVAVNGKTALESEYAAAAAKIRSDYGMKIADIDAQIADVDGKLTQALNDFNLSYAAKLNTKLFELKAEREEKAAEVQKYNNEIAQKQADLDAKRKSTENELYSQALEIKKKENDLSALSEEERDKIYESVYDKMDEFLSGMTKEQARVEIRNHTLYRDHLSDYYYYRLYNKYGR